MIDRTDFAYSLGIMLAIAFTLGLAFLAIFVSAKRADRVRSTRQRMCQQHWSIRFVARAQSWERQFWAKFERRGSRRRR